MPERLYRVSPVDLELRGDGRTVVGIAMPFDQPTEIREDGQTYTESSGAAASQRRSPNAA